MMRSGSAVQVKGLGSHCLGDEAVDGSLEVNEGAEDAALEATAELGDGLHGVDPRARGWGEVKDEPGMPIEPGADLGVLVGGIVVHSALSLIHDHAVGSGGRAISRGSDRHRSAKCGPRAITEPVKLREELTRVRAQA